MKSDIKISSDRYSEFNTKFDVGDKTYQIQTEDLGTRSCKIVTRIYSGGEIISSVSSDYSHLAKNPELKDKLRKLMERQHQSAMETFIKENRQTGKTKAQYAVELRELIKQGNMHAALDMSHEALGRFPADPFFLCYSGYLSAVAEKKYRDGTKICAQAIILLKKSKSTDISFFLPLFHLLMGKAYLTGNDKKNAIKAFKEGLRYDPDNTELLSEMKKFPPRKQPVLTFLDRDNPLNIYLGKLRYNIQSKK